MRQNAKFSDLRLDIKYIPREARSEFSSDDSDLKSVDFEYLNKQMYHINRLKISDHSRMKVINTMISDYLSDSGLNCPVNKIFDILELTKG